jgi:AcrR family transcriptional regulator
VAAKKKTAKTAARQRAPRKTPDFDQVIAVTTRLLHEKGDQRLRIEDITAETGVAKSSLYLKFGDRDGLVAAALARQFQEIVTESLDGLRFVVERAKTPLELEQMLGVVLKMTLGTQRDQERMTRIAVLANTIGEPKFRSYLEETQTALTDGIAELIELAAERGLARPAFDSRTIANFVQAYTLGRVLVSFDRNRRPDEADEWARLIGEIIRIMFFAKA